jgi:hypothetical protein
MPYHIRSKNRTFPVFLYMKPSVQLIIFSALSLFWINKRRGFWYNLAFCLHLSVSVCIPPHSFVGMLMKSPCCLCLRLYVPLLLLGKGRSVSVCLCVPRGPCRTKEKQAISSSHNLWYLYYIHIMTLPTDALRSSDKIIWKNMEGMVLSRRDWMKPWNPQKGQSVSGPVF